ncbi:hypothetical protein PtA15_6A616 [Puccinia triticina]|uniref:Uncharacterized protein n=1 Tax=Puccinia triticina TaxID=208348 RepID=A0ABY7CL75_9BASI|nr:uncharacterized protein PtA15_6A616 [Puccinia triticina]WAQ85986.1 hypothetical protein PtA15_6A616 [Puccinia triticina]WAR55885.1 hypothetical protein PtB15_6B629 [Puccinia triticina]
MAAANRPPTGAAIHRRLDLILSRVLLKLDLEDDQPDSDDLIIILEHPPNPPAPALKTLRTPHLIGRQLRPPTADPPSTTPTTTPPPLFETLPPPARPPPETNPHTKRLVQPPDASSASVVSAAYSRRKGKKKRKNKLRVPLCGSVRPGAESLT